MTVKEYKPPYKGTLVCHWCGCTNHADRLKDVRFYRIDGIMGDACCWDMVKTVMNEIGVTNKDTLMRDIVKALKEAKKLVEIGKWQEIL